MHAVPAHDLDVPALRLSAQHITRAPDTHAHPLDPANAPRPTDAVDVASLIGALGALQSQDLAASLWAVGLRLPGRPTEGTIEAALAAGAVLRTHTLRWTWQLVAPADVRGQLALVAPRLFAQGAKRHRELGLDASTFARSERVFQDTLSDGEFRTRSELGSALTRAGIDPGAQRLSHLLGHAELVGLLCSGARHGKETSFALLDARAPATAAPMPREAALAKLAGQYFRTRGPATVADFAWWTGLTQAEARVGHAAVESTLVATTIAGRTLWRSAASAPASAPAGETPTAQAAFLPAFDEYLVAYARRDAVLDPDHAKRVNAGGGMLDPVLVLAGRVAGTWRRTLTRERVSIRVKLFEPIDPAWHPAIEAAAERYAAFLGRAVDLAPMA